MKKYFKHIAAFLILTFTLQLVPIKAIADTINPQSIKDTPQINVSPKQEAKIIGELTDKREKNIKRFMKDDHTYEADIYPTAIHYLVNGQWKDIDNSLVDAADEDNVDVLQNKGNSYKVKIAKNTKANKLVRLQKDQYELSWNIDGAQQSKAQAVSPDMTKYNALSDNDKKRTLTNIASEVNFTNFLPDTDLQYEIQPEAVKENIIINKNNSTQQFQFNLNVKNLTAKLQDNKSILFYDINDNSKNIFKIDAPFMIDAAGKKSSDLNITLEPSQKGYTLKMIPNSDWLNSPDRVYPIKIDPTVGTSLASDAIHDTFISKDLPNQTNDNSYLLEVGYGSISGINRTLIKFDIPSLTSADMVIDAKLYLSLYSANDNVRQIDARNITSGWDSASVTWNTAPSYDTSRIEDYQMVQGSAYSDFAWDITKVVKNWYNTENSNNGIMLMNHDETTGYNEFFSENTDPSYSQYRAQVIISYINNSGLEDFWTYHSQSAGRAGTAYLNDYSGNLSFIHEDLNMDGNLVPVNIKHVYNENTKLTDIKYGPGWRLNVSARVDYNSSLNQYYYTDEDGTIHYFTYSSGAYKDEYGADITLVKNADGTYTIKDKQDNALTFTPSGYLWKITDNNGKTQILSYNGADLMKITDGSGRVTTLTRTAEGYLTGIVDPAGRTTSFSYNGAQLSRITYPDGNYTLYSYDSSNKLLSATNYDGYKLIFTYCSGSVNRLQQVQETHTNGTIGQKLNISYGYNTTTFTDAKNRKNIYIFNDLGSTVSIKDDDGSAEYYKYLDSNDKYKLSVNSKLQKTVTNYLLNHNAEASTSDWLNQNQYWGSSTGSSGYTAEAAYLGSHSLKVTKTNTSDSQFVTQNVYPEKGKTYTFSAYVKTSNISNVNPDTKGALLFINYYDKNDSLVTVKSPSRITGTNDWQKIEVTFTLPSDAISNKLWIRGGIEGETGDAYFDCLQLEDGSIANRYNLVENSSLEYGTGTPTLWIKNTYTNANDTLVSNNSAPAALGGKSFKINGDATKNKNLYQIINVSGKIGDTFAVSGWAKGNSVKLNSPNREFAIDIGFLKYDGTYENTVVPFNEDSLEWQYISNVAQAKSDYKSIAIYTIYYDNGNFAQFDGIQLFKEEFGTSYTYDSKGNLLSVADLAKKNSSFTYSNNDLTKYTDPKGNNFNYTYYTANETGNPTANTHNLKTATSAGKVVYSFTYDSNGNPLTSQVGDPASLFTKATAAYTPSGNYVASITDALSNKIQNSYSESKDNLESAADANGNRLFYSYDSMDRMTSAFKVNLPSNYETFPLNGVSVGTKGTQANIDTAVYTKDEGAKPVLSAVNGSSAAYNLGIKNASGTTTVWFRPNGDTGTTRYILASRKDTDTILCIYTKPDNYIYVAVRDSSGSWNAAIKSTNAITTGWNFAGLTWDNAGGNLNLTLNLNGTKNMAAVPSCKDFTGAITSVGSFSDGTYSFNGLMRQFNYTESKLSDEDITNIYTSELAKPDQKTIQNSYTYENDRIKQISQNGVNYTFGYDSLGNNTIVNVGTQRLITNNYDLLTGLLTGSTYGNGQTVNSTYDNLDRVTSRLSQGAITDNYEYDASGNLGYHEDISNGVTYKYYYDISDRLVKVADNKGSSKQYGYDLNNNASTFTENLGVAQYVTSYGYDSDNKPTSVDYSRNGNSSNVSYSYDSLGRVKSKKIVSGTATYNTNYTYVAGVETNSTTNLIASITDTAGNSVSCTYDANGNIKTAVVNGKNIKYYYNDLNELTREDNEILNKTITYSYDNGGNIVSKNEYALTSVENPVNSTLTIAYAYTDSNWKDKLTSYDGKDITYDNIGNPTKYNGWAFTWEQGRQLSGMSKTGMDVSFKYNDSGIRTQKTVNGVTTNYYLDGDKVTYEDNGTDKIYYTYDSTGSLVSMNLNGAEYYYIRNAQGDIIGLFDKSGTTVASYTYDSWGKLISIKDSSGADITNSTDSVGHKNQYRYRGYRYDTETGLYYLQSRYYNPEWGRFINCDDDGGEMGTLLSHNMFLYCFNNPVNMTDEDGQWPSWATKVLIGVGAIVLGAVITVATGGAGAAFIPALVVGTQAALTSATIGAAVGAGASAVSHRVSTGSWKGSRKAALNGAVNGAADGFMTGGIMAGASQAISGGFKMVAKATVNAGKKVSGIRLTKNIKVLSPDKLYHNTNGGTLLKIGKSLRVDVNSQTLLHMHFPGAFSSTHFPIGIIGAGIYGGLKR